MSIPAAAERAGARDLFVLRKVSDDNLFNVDGHGRGAGWAGNVSLDPANEPWVARVLEEGVGRRRSGVPFRAFGPYWASEVAGVASDHHVVVFGGSGVSEIEDETLRNIASDAASAAREVSAAKLEADEAEVRQAIEELRAGSPATVDDAARHLASTTAKVLSCEFSAVLLTGPPVRVHIADEGWHPGAGEQEIIAALLPLQQVARDHIYVEQDLSASVFPYPPLSFDDGLVARCVVPLGEEGSMGLLLAAHAGSAARGFTSLCQRVARTMGEEGGALLASAAEEKRS